MTLQNSYTIEVSVNNTPIELDPSEFSFSIRDSIHEFFNRASLSINDETSILHDALIGQMGLPYRIDYGYIDEELSLPFVVDKSSTEDTFTTGLLNGPIDIELVHEWKNEQEAVSAAYEDTVTGAVEEVVDYGDFEEELIESTEGERIWYRPFLTQSEFIQKILLPNAFSFEAEDSPFFAFIDSKHTFRFQSYAQLWESSPIDTFVMSQSQENFIGRNIIADLKPFTTGMDLNYNLRNRRIYNQDSESGDFEFYEQKINDLPFQRTAFPDESFLGPSSAVTGMYNKGYFLQDEKEYFVEANVIHSARKAFFPERFIVTLSGLNTRVTAGNTINMDIIVHTSDGKTLSDYWTGKYLVETSDHVWNGERQMGYSQFIISRRGVNYPSNSLVGDLSYGR